MKTMWTVWMALAAAACVSEPTPDEADQRADSGACVAPDISDLQLGDTFTAVDHGWDQVERWLDPRPEIQPIDFPPDGRGDTDGQRRVLFGDEARPAAGAFLLYYAPGWDVPAAEPPVLLVHGANDNPDRAWANPGESGDFGCGQLSCPNQGLMQHLAAAGRRVFAIGFGHRQGDNLIAARLVSDALRVVRARTGACAVDLVGWSMGAFSARLYASGLMAGSGGYAGDVRRLVLIGAPNGGFDYIFRYGMNHNNLVFTECAQALGANPINAPSPHTSSACLPTLFPRFHRPELSIYATAAGDFYPGQKQMLARWDGVYPIPFINQDWFTTYHGGAGFGSTGLGIDAAMAQGSLVASMQSAGVPASIETFSLCGDITGAPGKLIPIIPNELSGPSDGIVFNASCADSTGIGDLVEARFVVENHLQLGWAPAAMAVVEGWLAQ